MSAIEFEVVDWTESNDLDPRLKYTAAEVKILVGDILATRVFDSWSKTVTDRVRLPVYPFAEWLAINWWRLHSEPPVDASGKPPVDWRLAHDVGSIGRGFIWPRLRFASDDASLYVSARAFPNAPWEPIRYLNDIPATPVSIQEFDNSAKDLIDLVLTRLRELEIDAEPLSTIWADVIAEQGDPELALWRTYEARLGYDADEAPERLIGAVEGLLNIAGKSAAEELLPVLRPNELDTIQRLKDLSNAPGVSATFPSIEYQSDILNGRPPWEAGRQIAQLVRTKIDRVSGPLDDSDLSRLLGIQSDVLHRKQEEDGIVGLGVRAPSSPQINLHFRKRNPAGRRFEAARFLAEHLTAPDEDRWLPLTDRGSTRQKLQRAFAAEFLAPINDLRDFIGPSGTTELMEEAGDVYGVSPLAIRSQLANHGLLAPEDVVA